MFFRSSDKRTEKCDQPQRKSFACDERSVIGKTVKKSKKLLTKSSESDILNKLSRETAKESSKRATKKNEKVLDKDKSF